MVVVITSVVTKKLKLRHTCQTWAQDTFKISSSWSSSYFYIQDKNQVLGSLKKYKLKQESLVSRKFKQEFYVSIKQNVNPVIRALSKKPKYFVFEFYLLAGYKIETIVTLNYGGKIICVIANFIFSQFFNENCRQQHYLEEN